MKNYINASQLKEVFVKEAQIYFERFGKNFEIDQLNEWFINLLCLYFCNDPKFNESKHIQNSIGGSLHKGIYVYGSCGVGKTTTFKIFHAIFKKYHLNHQFNFRIVSTNLIVTQYNQSGDQSLNHLFKGHLYMDDLGSENTAYHYGNKEDIFRRIIEERYNLYIDQLKKTFITSNLTPNEIQDRYTQRVFDRLIEFCNILPFDGESRRR